ncbi:GNAT family N-acetyltransferase [Bacillus shivajii]|nr:GNAT family N-acetyltransferase [Bacillus shivajii]UCZ55309.1 GNAT family N-acetyltransferase [Bacillus shivajii]
MIAEFEDLEFQVFRMQENMKKIAKNWNILGIDQTKEEKWVIVYASDDGNVCKIMLHDCETPFDGSWDFSIHAQYDEHHQIHIDDIRGDENRGFGSICMNFLKEHALEQNISCIKGDIVKRDWGHIDRLIHFYEKHHFHVSIEQEKQHGMIYWQPSA